MVCNAFPTLKDIHVTQLAEGRVVDYAMIHMNDLCMVKEFWLGEKNSETDHLALGVTLDICYYVGHEEGTKGNGALRVDEDKKQVYAGHLDSFLSNLTTNTWADLRDAMLNTAVEVFGRPKGRLKNVRGMPCKSGLMMNVRPHVES